MNPGSVIDTPVKPRVLIADDSRIVRATLVKRIEGLFDFREAHDGEQAWEILLLDPSIRVVITDLTMPKLDGYGLLQRIRNSKISRIREIPVIVVSGSDEREERARAKAAGATDLITKGIATAQLLSRLDILSRLVGTQHEFERNLEALVRNAQPEQAMELQPAEALATQAGVLLAYSVRHKRNFVLLKVCVALRHSGLDGVTVKPPVVVVDAVGQLLRRTVRQTDLVAKTGEAEFTLATGSINFDAARCFAQRVCRAIAGAHLLQDSRMTFVASCGLVSLNEEDADPALLALEELQRRANRRALLGLERGWTGVTGPGDEPVLENGPAGSNLSAGSPPATEPGDTREPDLATLLQWIREGRQAEVRPHLARLSTELQPLVDLVLRQEER